MRVGFFYIMLSANQQTAELKLLLEANERQLQVARSNRANPRVLTDRIARLEEHIQKLTVQLEAAEMEYLERDTAVDALLLRREELQLQMKQIEHRAKIARVLELRRQLGE